MRRHVVEGSLLLERLRGSHFDPAVADALLAVVGRGLQSGSSAEATLSP